MAENKQELPLPIEVPTIKKVVDCPRCKAKIEVEFEVDIAPLIPMALAGMEQPKEKEKDDKD